MTCDDVRRWMLEADLVELAGATPPDVAGHIESCARCQSATARIVHAEGQLAQVLERFGPSRSADALIGDATSRRRMPRWLALVPLAAAAGFAVLLLGRGGPALQPYRPPAPSAPVFAVEAPSGLSVAVFETDNPNITVVWFH